MVARGRAGGLWQEVVSLGDDLIRISGLAKVILGVFKNGFGNVPKFSMAIRI